MGICWKFLKISKVDSLLNYFVYLRWFGTPIDINVVKSTLWIFILPMVVSNFIVHCTLKILASAYPLSPSLTMTVTKMSHLSLIIDGANEFKL